jgi:hypothetical protein
MFIQRTTAKDREVNTRRYKEFVYALYECDVDAIVNCLHGSGKFFNLNKEQFIEKLRIFYAPIHTEIPSIIIYEGISLHALPGSMAVEARYSLKHTLQDVFGCPLIALNSPPHEGERILRCAFTFKNSLIYEMKATQVIKRDYHVNLVEREWN